MKKVFIALIGVFLIAVILVAVIFTTIPNAVKNFNEDFSITIPKTTEVLFEENEVAFDGSSFVSVFQIDSSDTSMIIDQVEQAGWTKLPISPKSAYALTKRVDSLIQEDAKMINLSCKNGYFIIKQNSSFKSTSKSDPTSNRKMALFDLDQGQIYYCRWTY